MARHFRSRCSSSAASGLLLGVAKPAGWREGKCCLRRGRLHQLPRLATVEDSRLVESFVCCVGERSQRIAFAVFRHDLFRSLLLSSKVRLVCSHSPSRPADTDTACACKHARPRSRIASHLLCAPSVCLPRSAEECAKVYKSASILVADYTLASGLPAGCHAIPESDVARRDPPGSLIRSSTFSGSL